MKPFKVHAYWHPINTGWVIAILPGDPPVAIVVVDDGRFEVWEVPAMAISEAELSRVLESGQ